MKIKDALSKQEISLGEELESAGDLSGALLHFQSAVTLLRDQHGQDERDNQIPILFKRIGCLLIDLEDFSGAADFLQQSLELQTCGDEKNELLYGEFSSFFRPYSPFFTAETHSSLGSALSDQNREAALAHFHAALDIYQQREPSLDFGDVLNNIGAVLETKDDLDHAAEFYLRALDVYCAIGDSEEEVVDLLERLGGISEVKGDLEDARNYYERALSSIQSEVEGNCLSETLSPHQLTDHFSLRL